MAELLWYNTDEETDESLRRILVTHRNKAEEALETLNISSFDYINNFNNYISIDNDTYCKFLIKNSNLSLFSMSKPFAQGKVGKVSHLYSEKLKLIIKSIDNIEPLSYFSIRIIDYPGEQLNPWNNYWRIYDQNKNRKIISVGGDNFSNQTSLHLILNLILGDNLNYIRQYDAFYCNKSGYNITELSNSGDLHNYINETISYRDINDNMLINIMKGVLTPLSILKQPIYNFNHSDLKAKNVFVHNLNGEIIFKLADFDKSSITWKGFRFYNNSFDYITNVNKYITLNQYGRYSLSSIISNFSTKFSDLSLIQMYTMHNPYTIPQSYDIYTFFISLFAIKNVRDKYLSQDNTFTLLDRIVNILFKEQIYYNIFLDVIRSDKYIELSSISKINNHIIEKIELEYNVDDIYYIFGINPPIVDHNHQNINIVISNDLHLCSDQCKIHPEHNKGYMYSNYKTCNTNTYSKTLINKGLYNWDYC